MSKKHYFNNKIKFQKSPSAGDFLSTLSLLTSDFGDVKLRDLAKLYSF